MSRKKGNVQVGDIFSIPVDGERVGYGQILAPYGDSGGHFYFGVFDGVYARDEEPDLDAVVGEPWVFLALSMDSLLVHGHWQVVSRREVDERAIPWPAYKVGVTPPGAFDVVDYTGQRRRSASDEEAESLPFQTVVAPIRLEKALRAHHGLDPWDEVYDALRPVEAEKTSAALLR